MKTILMLIVGLMLAGCGSMENEVRKSSTSDLLLRRSQLMYRLSMTRTSWGNRPFESCQDVWREANNTHREFVRLFSLVFGKPTPLQRGTFISAQLAFADALEAGKPFMNQAVWKAFFEFENLMIVWKDVEIPKESTKESREEARLGLERCAEEIRKRFSELLVV